MVFMQRQRIRRFTAAGLRCCENLKNANFTSSLERQKFAPKSVPHVQLDYFSSFNQSNHSFVALSLLSSLLKLSCIITFKISVMPEVFFFTAIKRKDTSCRYSVSFVFIRLVRCALVPFGVSSPVKIVE